MTSNTNRRGFFKRLSGNSKDTVKLLTPDGQLVEVSEEHLKNAKREKVTNKKIAKWSNQVKSLEEDGEG